LKTRVATGFNPKSVWIPKRFTEIVTWKGSMDTEYLQSLKDEYSKRIIELSADNEKGTEEKT